MGDGGVKFMCAGEVKIKVAAASEPSRAQVALVVVTCGMEDDDVVLAFFCTGRGKLAVATAERWQERRHTLVGER